MRGSGVTLLALALISACQPSSGGSGNWGQAWLQRELFHGRALVETFHTQAVSADLVNRAAVSLIDGANNVVAAGTTDAAGNFTLYRSTEAFTPLVNTTYVLEIGKRVAVAGGRPSLSLKTVMRYEAGGWNSITGTTIVVNLTTTAMAVLQEGSSGAVTQADVIGTVSGGPAYTTAAAVPGILPATVTATATNLQAKLTANLDPVGQANYYWPGNLMIVSPSDAEMAALVDEIGGDLIIRTTAMNSLTLANLKAVQGSLIVGAESGGMTNFMLMTFSFPKLASVGGRLLISNNAALRKLDGLSALTQVDGDLTISQNPMMNSISGLSQLTKIGPNLTMYGNTMLPSLHGLQNVSVPTGLNVDIRNHMSLTNLANFPVIANLGGLTLISNAITDATGLDGVHAVQNLTIESHANLTNLAALANLNSATGLSIRFNTNLPNCEATSLRDRLGLTLAMISGNQPDACP